MSGKSGCSITLSRAENQARGIGQYAIDFIRNGAGQPAEAVLQRVELFHRDSVACGVSALALRANAPTVLRREALGYPVHDEMLGARLFGSSTLVQPEKAVVANSSAVREWDANGTNFGYDPKRGNTAGEFGHNDFYPVAVAAAQQSGADGRRLLLAMLCLDEIRGRLAEVFALKNHKIDHVLHGAIASAAVYGALLGATANQIEAAVGLVVAHYVPFRAIRAGHQLSDSKGASAALSAEVAVTSMRRAMLGFVGPADIFRNPQAVFCLFEPPESPNSSPFDLTLGLSGDDFSILGMHFKLGLYEHQSAGAIQGLMDLLDRHPGLLDDPALLQKIEISIYEPAFGIIGDPAKRDPRTRQSADHSMVYIIATLLRKAYELRRSGWEALMLMPADYDDASLHHPLTRQIMEKIVFSHGGPTYDANYPDGIPTTVEIRHDRIGTCSSGLIMYPEGHARCVSDQRDKLLDHKFTLLTAPAVDDAPALRTRMSNLADQSPQEVRSLYRFAIRDVVDHR